MSNNSKVTKALKALQSKSEQQKVQSTQTAHTSGYQSQVNAFKDVVYGSDATYTTVSTSPDYGSMDFGERLKEDKKDMLESILNIDKLIKRVEELQFSKGDIVFHKQYGVCIVQEIGLPGLYTYNNAETQELSVLIAHKDGSAHANPDELVPKTDLSEAIYEK